ncbi:MAG: DUF1501 domain-containing protein [Bacteroidota bacterium]
MKRRDFLQRSSVISLPIFLNGMGVKAMGFSPFNFGPDINHDRVLVIIQMDGGNDGLNMVLPIDQYANLSAARSNILIPENQALELTIETGLHPVMTGVKSLYDDQKVSVIHSVAYPNQNRSHFRSKDIWQSGSSADEFVSTGWLGRFFDSEVEGFPTDYPNEEYPDPFAITIGGFVTETCQGSVANYSLALVDPFNLSPLGSGAAGSIPNDNYGKELSFLRTSIAQSNAYAAVITDAAEGGNTLSEKYDDNNNLAQKLKIVAQLISGGLDTKVYVVNIGGFDTHANQTDTGDTTTGNHATLLSQISNAIESFQDDLELLGLSDRVMGMTFSEFGRRIRSNGSGGTDHGTAAPMIVFGNCIKTQMLGQNPEISANPDVQEGVAMQHDFRSVYGSILMDWFNVPEDDIRTLLYQDFQHLPILCDLVSNEEQYIDNLPSKNFPNPFENFTDIEFTCEQERVRISIFDVIGNEIKVLSDQNFNAGTHKVRFEAHGMPAGNYYYRITIGNKFTTKLMVKL